MKPVKFVTLALGVLFVISVFLPFFSLGGMSISLWKLRAAKAAPAYIALLSGLAVAGLSFAAVRGRLTRGLAAGIAVGSIVAAVIALVQFESKMPLMKVGGFGAKVLVFGGVISFIAAIAGLIKPERANA